VKQSFVALTLLGLSALAWAASLRLKDLPPAVQKTVGDTLKGGQIRNISKEVEKGVTQYEVETMLNGKHRDFEVDAKGKLLVVEEETDVATIARPRRWRRDQGMTMPRLPILAAQLFFFGVIAAWSQPTSPGTIRGQVTDPAGASVPDALVAVNNGHGTSRTATTNVRGEYVLASLPADNYTVRISAKGFAAAEALDIALTPGAVRTLDVPLTLASDKQSITVTDTAPGAHVNVDPSANADALVLRGSDLDALSDDPDDLADDLTALAGPGAGPNGGQIYIDGFTGGRMPAKSSIREIRINQNPFSAQYDRIGMGRVEIFTKPGTDDLHGEIQTHDGSDLLNARNPFTPVKPAWQRLGLEGEVSGPIGKKTSFFADFEVRKWTENSFVNALTLGSNFQVLPVAQAVLTPRRDTEENVKIDRQLSANQTLTLRYTFARTAIDDQGASGFSLPTRTYNYRDGEDTIQFVESGVYGSHVINETRARYSRLRTNEHGTADLPTISVLDSFTGGGSPLTLNFTNHDPLEVQNMTTFTHGTHLVRWGGRLRGDYLSDQDTTNYTGTFTFSSLDAYRITLMGLQAGWSATQIHAEGGGASQFSIAAGNPLASLNQFDAGLYILDDWRARPNLTVSLGLRYEAQSRISDHHDVAPRLGIAWGLGGNGKPAKTVIRAGAGLFYDRVSDTLSLDAIRRNGVNQQQFVLDSPDFYPTIPSLSTLLSDRVPQAIREMDDHIVAPYMTQFGIGVERQLPKNVTLATNYLHSRGSHELRSRVIPPPANLAVPDVTEIYLYESSGIFKQDQLVTSVNARINANISFNSSYTFGKANSDTDGASTFPADSNDLRPEYGRAGFDIRHRVQVSGSFAFPWGLRLSPMFIATSSRPFNITTGTDLNGDTVFTDRPAFATDLSRSSVRVTRFGAFDLDPSPGQTIVPRNYGVGPGLVSLNLRLAKTFKLGKEVKGRRDPMELTFTALSRNLLNHPNLALPDGNLSSPLFGESTALVTAGGGNSANGNRRIELQLRLAF
jgi:Carboxypeptidase regulatory-like domain